MRVNRRSFFAGLAGLGALAATSASQGGHETINGWCIRWSGWRESPSQITRMGFWFAIPPSDYKPADGDCRLWFSTTGGQVLRGADRSVIDTTRKDDSWPVSLLASDAEFEAAKQGARHRLIEAILA